MKVKVGELDKRISIVEIIKGDDDEGFPINEEKEILSCWASVSNKSGTEIFKANADYSKVVTRFLIRYRKDIIIDTTKKIRFQDRLYNIVYANNYNFDNTYLEIIAEVIE
ncbi:phage head closure protein [Proteiniborus sp. MB09-C3]|uniref:phage head closure protein n=1 Tax=Proteiniborus sp. MB09-C3 TaxID=3050072 RepID=UPI002556482F|nr:phage head closure protein [Proteiniborus sp. MB09-C3]WIV10541.1 phage head closure protein [Proteiniborus sp. MB09-C3]